MKVVAFITEYAVVDRIIDHLKLGFVADRPPPCSPHVFHEGRRLMSSSRLRSWRPLRPAREDFPSKVAFRASIFFVIDIAARPEVYYQRGQLGRFIGRSGYRGAAEKGISGPGKGISYPFFMG